MINITNSRAIERAALAARLRLVEAGEVVTYSDLDQACGCDVRASRHILASARAELRDEDSIVFESLAGIGLRRLTEAERGTVAPDRRRRRAFRQAQTSLKEMRGLEQALLTPGERQQFFARYALISAIAAVSTHRALQKVLAISPRDDPVLPVDQTLESLKGIR